MEGTDGTRAKGDWWRRSGQLTCKGWGGGVWWLAVYRTGGERTREKGPVLTAGNPSPTGTERFWRVKCIYLARIFHGPSPSNNDNISLFSRFDGGRTNEILTVQETPLAYETRTETARVIQFTCDESPARTAGHIRTEWPTKTPSLYETGKERTPTTPFWVKHERNRQRNLPFRLHVFHYAYTVNVQHLKIPKPLQRS